MPSRSCATDTSATPVVDEEKTIVGMLSDRDVRTAIGDPLMFIESRRQSTAQFHVYDVMAKPAVVVPFDASLLELARRFADERVPSWTGLAG